MNGTKDQRPRIRRKTQECRDLLTLNHQLIEDNPVLWFSPLGIEYGNYLESRRDELARWRQRLSETPA